VRSMTWGRKPQRSQWPSRFVLRVSQSYDPWSGTRRSRLNIRLSIAQPKASAQCSQFFHFDHVPAGDVDATEKAE